MLHLRCTGIHELAWHVEFPALLLQTHVEFSAWHKPYAQGSENPV